jgi:hypothetical protein
MVLAQPISMPTKLVVIMSGGEEDYLNLIPRQRPTCVQWIQVSGGQFRRIADALDIFLAKHLDALIVDELDKEGSLIDSDGRFKACASDSVVVVVPDLSFAAHRNPNTVLTENDNLLSSAAIRIAGGLSEDSERRLFVVEQGDLARESARDQRRRPFHKVYSPDCADSACAAASASWKAATTGVEFDLARQLLRIGSSLPGDEARALSSLARQVDPDKSVTILGVHIRANGSVACGGRELGHARELEVILSRVVPPVCRLVSKPDATTDLCVVFDDGRLIRKRNSGVRLQDAASLEPRKKEVRCRWGDDGDVIVDETTVRWFSEYADKTRAEPCIQMISVPTLSFLVQKSKCEISAFAANRPLSLSLSRPPGDCSWSEERSRLLCPAVDLESCQSTVKGRLSARVVGEKWPAICGEER